MSDKDAPDGQLHFGFVELLFSLAVAEIASKVGIKEPTIRLWFRNGNHFVDGVLVVPMECSRNDSKIKRYKSSSECDDSAQA